MISDDVFFWSVRAQGEAIKSGKLSPVELAEGYLNRLEKIGPKLGAVVTVARDTGLSRPARRKKRSLAATIGARFTAFPMERKTRSQPRASQPLGEQLLTAIGCWTTMQRL